MFDVLVESTSERRNARTWLFFAGSSVVWATVLAGAAIAGVMMVDARLDADLERLDTLAAVAPPGPPAPRARAAAPAPSHERPAGPTFVAVTHPNEVVGPPRPPAAASGPFVVGGIDGGDPNARLPGDPGGTGDVGIDRAATGSGPNPVTGPPQTPPDPPADPVARPPARPRHIGIISGLALRRVEPPYPSMAKAIGADGPVVVSVTVSETGDVLEAHAVSGHPTLRTAAVDAARRWRFTPTILNGTPIKVIGTITFNFKRS